MKKLVILMVVLLLVGCRAAPEIAAEEPVISVAITPLSTGNVIEGFLTLGTVEPLGVVDVAPVQGGVVESIFVQSGDRVSAGDVLYSLASNTQKNALNQTESSLRANRNTLGVQLSDARRNYNTVKALYDQGAASKRELDTAASQVKSLQIRYGDAQTAYDNQVSSLRSAVADSDVKAPISGYLSNVSIERGEVVSGQSVIQIVDDSKFVVSSQLTAEQLRQIEGVEKIDIYLNGNRASRVMGQVERIDYVQSTATGTYPVRLSLESTDQSIYDGEYVEVFYQTATRRVQQLPVSAIKTLGQDVYAFYVEGDRAVRQSITVGRYSGDQVEVIGATARDWIVSNVDQLQDGVKIKVVE